MLLVVTEGEGGNQGVSLQMCWDTHDTFQYVADRVCLDVMSRNMSELDQTNRGLGSGAQRWCQRCCLYE